MIKLYLLTLFSVYSLEKIQAPDSEFHRCKFKSENHIVEHYFKIDPEFFGTKCEYAIMVDDKLFKQYKGDSESCQKFIRTQINKGSVCMNNMF